MKTILLLLTIVTGAYGESIYYQDELYTVGNRIETTARDTTIFEKQFRGLQEVDPNKQVYGVVTAVSSEGWFLLIRCVVKARDRPTRQILAELDVESNRHIKSFNVAIEDTLLANSIRTYIFRKHVSIIEVGNDQGLQRLWNWHLRYDNAGSFKWTFNERRIR